MKFMLFCTLMLSVSAQSVVFINPTVTSTFTDGAVSTNNGIDRFGYAYSATLLPQSITVSGVPFTLGKPNVPNAISSTTLALRSTKAKAVTILATAVNGNQLNQTFKLIYGDGSTTSTIRNMSDWWQGPQGYSGEVAASAMNYRNSNNGSAENHTVTLYSYSLNVNALKSVQQLVLPNNNNVVVLAVTVTQSSPPPPSTITLPIEVCSSDGVVSKTVNTPSGLTGPFTLYLRIHNLKYDTEASMRWDSNSWVSISTQNVVLQGLANRYGGIGGGFHTPKLTMSLPTVTAGSHTLSFRFNGTNGISSCYRVLAFNIRNSTGADMLPANAFVQDDPSRWTIPLNTPADIAAGKSAFQAENTLQTDMNHPGPSGTIIASCSDCHTQDGRDLKYFNYSNHEIKDRAQFHGLSALQGDQIASYIRSLTTPAPSSARPWNPPYQPGPGLDSQPIQNWAAGAGIDAVLDNDMQMLPYMNTANFGTTAYLPQREVPIDFQLPDWNRWLPVIHPLDAWPSFATSAIYATYHQLRNTLKPGDASAYQSAVPAYGNWGTDFSNFINPLTKAMTDPAWQNPLYTEGVYGAGQWQMAKHWELNQEYSLEGMPSVVFGAHAQTRAWYSQNPWTTSPNIRHIPAGPGLGNGTSVCFLYFSTMWYQLQLILNDGNGTFVGNSPIDHPYAYNFLASMGYGAVGANPALHDGPPGGALMVEWLVNGIQQSEFNSGPENGSSGWQWGVNDPSVLATYPNSLTLWNGYSAAQVQGLLNAYLSVWITKISSFSVQQLYAGGWATPTEIIDPTQAQGSLGDRVANMMFGYTYLGVDKTILTKIVTWAQTVWPTFNWTSLLTMTCTLPPGSPYVVCQ